MGFTSLLYPGETIIDDGTPSADKVPVGQGRGLILPMSHNPEGGNYGDLADGFPPDLLISESDIEGWIKEKEERQNRISDELIRRNVPCKDQNGTNYCWINAPVFCTEVVRMFQNEAHVELSPASVGCKIKNFKNQGGWGEEGLRYIVEHGVVPVNLWPANAISRQYDKPEYWTAAEAYKVTEWTELRPRNMQQIASLVLRNIPVAVGYNWWSHEVTVVDAVWLDGTLAIRIRNSWGMGWGDKGFGILKGNKMLADDAVAPRVSMAQAA